MADDETGLSPSDRAMSDFAFEALKPMVEAEKQRRAEGQAAPDQGTPTGVADSLTPEDRAMSDFAFEALKPMVDANQQRREGTEGAGLEHESTGATDGGSWLDGVNRGVRDGLEHSGLEHESTGATDDGNWTDGVRAGIQDGLGESGLEHESTHAKDGIDFGTFQGNEFDDRSPADMDPGFNAGDDGSFNGSDIDPGFTVPDRMTFGDDEGETITPRTSDDAGAMAEDSGFSDGY